MVIQKEELKNIMGGAFSAALLNAIISAFKGAYNLGVSLGSSIARFFSGKLC